MKKIKSDAEGILIKRIRRKLPTTFLRSRGT